MSTHHDVDTGLRENFLNTEGEDGRRELVRWSLHKLTSEVLRARLLDANLPADPVARVKQFYARNRNPVGLTSTSKDEGV